MNIDRSSTDKRSLKDIIFNPSPEFRASVEETIARLEGPRVPPPMSYCASDDPYEQLPTYKKSR